MAADEPNTASEAKPYVLYRVGPNDAIIERIAEAESVEDLFKAHRRHPPRHEYALPDVIGRRNPVAHRDRS